MILTVRTDNPQAELGLYQDDEQLAYKSWQAHRLLAETIHLTAKELLVSLGKEWKDVTGVVFYKGPGSFTGLRIGAAFGNAIATANNIPASAQNGEDWIQKGLKALQNGDSGPVLPEYGSEPKVTIPKK
jgi:tRNA threonylcarbamoyladenosine biosynthesis protein TsaB